MTCLSHIPLVQVTMVKKAAKSKDAGKSPRGKIGSKHDGPLPRSFNSRLRGKGPPSPRSSLASSPARSTAASSRGGGDEQHVPRKNLTGGFLMYIKAAIKSQSADAAEQARAVQDTYQGMSVDQKRALVDGFYRSGGKRQGLSSTYQQCLTMKNKCEDLSWEGYLTFGTLMTLWGVCSQGPRQT